MRTNNHQHLYCAIMIWAVLSGRLLCAAETEEDVIPVGTQKQLFVDHHLIESSRGVTLTMNEPRSDGKVLIKISDYNNRYHIVAQRTLTEEVHSILLLHLRYMLLGISRSNG